jgi:hypothetical protein
MTIMGKVLKFQSASPRPKLRGALQRGELVRVWRSNLEDGSFCGYLAGMGKEWLLMWVVGDQISFDGLYALRLADISEVEAPDGHHTFIEKALAIRNIHPRLPRNFPLDDISFEASDRDGQTLAIDGAYVNERVGQLSKNADLSRFIL